MIITVHSTYHLIHWLLRYNTVLQRPALVYGMWAHASSGGHQKCHNWRAHLWDHPLTLCYPRPSGSSLCHVLQRACIGLCPQVLFISLLVQWQPLSNFHVGWSGRAWCWMGGRRPVPHWQKLACQSMSLSFTSICQQMEQGQKLNLFISVPTLMVMHPSQCIFVWVNIHFTPPTAPSSSSLSFREVVSMASTFLVASHWGGTRTTDCTLGGDGSLNWAEVLAEQCTCKPLNALVVRHGIT